MTEKKIPLRRCVGCNTQGEKSSFARIVRSPDGKIVFDLSGKANGRGVYICKNIKCLEKAMKNHRPERNLGVSIPDEVFEEIKAKIEENND